MAKRKNYGFEKRQKELKRQKKKEEKAEKKRLKRESGDQRDPGEGAEMDEGPMDAAGTTSPVYGGEDADEADGRE